MFKRSQKVMLNQEIKQLFPRLWRYCLVLTGTADKASDLAQSVCLRALEKAHLLKDDAPFDRWAFRIAKNTWYNELRAERVREGAGVFAVEDVVLADSRQDPEQQRAHQDVIQHMLALPEAQRITVMLVYIEGCNYQEAAEILEIPVGTVMSRLAAARSKLSTKLAAFKRQSL